MKIGRVARIALHSTTRVTRFDKKFGADFVSQLPTTPAVYLFKDEAANVLYVGKAKNARQRLSTYRNASRRKAHKKMRVLVRDATELEVLPQATEEDALLLESELIRTLRPPHNVDGAFAFLYPAIRVRRTSHNTLFCFTTSVEAWDAFEFEWYGTFRSRPRAKEAFDLLIELVARVGHLERTASLGKQPDAKGSRLAGVRQLSTELVDGLRAFLSGASSDGLKSLALALLEKPGARRDAAEVQDHLRALEDFFVADLKKLHDALRACGRASTFVSQDERDQLFIRAAGLTETP